LSFVTLRVVLLLGALLVARPVFGGNTERPQGQALQFSVGRYLSLSDFGGATVCYQRSVSENLTWRLGVTVDLYYAGSEESLFGTGDAAADTSASTTDWSHQFVVTSEWLFWRGEPVSLYLGGGPRLSYMAWQSEYVHLGTGYAQGWYYARQSRGSGLSVGAAGVLGVQWAPSDWCALHAEYRVNAGYVRTVTETWISESSNEHYTYNGDVVSNGFSLDSEGVRVGLSVYF
jgi:hypothetical protein